MSQELANEVRRQSEGSSMKDLVFDPVTGEFKQVQKNSTNFTGDVVTEMTDKGFAFC